MDDGARWVIIWYIAVIMGGVGALFCGGALCGFLAAGLVLILGLITEKKPSGDGGKDGAKALEKDKARVQDKPDVNQQDENGDTALHRAVCAFMGVRTSREAIQTLLASGADVNVQNVERETPLHRAVKIIHARSPERVQLLLEAGANVHTQALNYLTPLHVAASSIPTGEFEFSLDKATPTEENPAVIEALLKAGADVNARDINDNSPLHKAACHCWDPAVIKILLDAGADIEARNGNGETPLNMAAFRNKYPAVIKAFLEAGADIEARDEKDRTPLYRAASRKSERRFDLSIMKMLLESGADVNVRNKDGAPLLHITMEKPELDTASATTDLEPLKERMEKRALEKLSEAAEVVKMLLKLGADVTALDESGNTPLHYAVAHNCNPEIIQILLKAGVNVKTRNESGETALQWRVYQLEDRGNTPLHYAVAHKDNPAVTQMLLKAGADVKVQNESGETALHWAAFRQVNPSVVNALLEAGAGLNAQDDGGNTPLHWAIKSSSYAIGDRGYTRPIVEILLKAGADTKIKNKEEKTSLDFAKEHNFPDYEKIFGVK